MGIKKFSQASGSTDLTVFFEWLNDNKADTFLEDLTITKSTTYHDNDTITFADTDSTVTLYARGGSNCNNSVVARFTAGALTDSVNTPSYASCNAYITRAILCSKGLILRYTGAFSSTTTTNNYGVCLTVDNDEKLAMLLVNSTIPAASVAFSSWDTLTAGSTTKMTRDVGPFYGANLSSFAQITAQGLETNAMLPYCYAAIATQIGSPELHSVLIDGAPYITNGIWYVKDTDEE